MAPSHTNTTNTHLVHLRQNFQVQLGPFVTELEKRGAPAFQWTQGTYKATPPAGFEDYFGGGPLWRFTDHDGRSSFDIVDRIRDIPQGPTAEATMRMLIGDEPGYTLSSVRAAVQTLLAQVDADPEIEVREL